MTPLEIWDASPDYPEGEYVNADLVELKANGLLVSRRRARTSLIEYGLPDWINAPTPAFSVEYFTYLVRRLFRQLTPAT